MNQNSATIILVGGWGGVHKNKSDGVQTWHKMRSGDLLVSELSFKFYSYMFLELFCSILVKISDFSEIQLMRKQPTDYN